MVAGIPTIRGRRREQAALEALLAGVRRGQSAALVIRGEAGIGKSALLEYCAEQAADCRVNRIVGTESELELPFAALHQLCLPMLDALPLLAEPQERALQISFGQTAGTAPDRFVVGLAVLNLLSETAMKQPLVCLIDDAQWLDDASAQVLGFVGRRLLAESVVMIFAVRETGAPRVFPDLPDLALEGLADADARALLAVSVPGQLDDQVRDRLVAETGGNPLALLELPRGMTQAELAGGFGFPMAALVSSHMEDHYLQRIRALPAATQQLILVAAADPTADPALVWSAAHTLGIQADAATAADDADLLQIGSRVLFRHPLVRSAAYTAATPEERSAAHAALAAVTDPERDPERRVWHLAAATDADEAVAVELEQTAKRVLARAGLAAAAAFLDRAAALTPDPVQRVDRSLYAAHAHLHAGEFGAARKLLAEASAFAVDDLQRGRIEQRSAQIESAAEPGPAAPARLLHAASRLEALDARSARDTYLQAWWAAVLAGQFAAPEANLEAVCRAALAAPRAAEPGPLDLLLEGLATAVIDGRPAAAPVLREAVDLYVADQVTENDWVLAGRSATSAAYIVWDVDSWRELSDRQVSRARASGALASLAVALNLHAFGATCCGDLETARLLVEEQSVVKDVTGVRVESYGAPMLAAYQGRTAERSLQLTTTAIELTRGEDGYALEFARLGAAVLNNALGRYTEALAAACEIAYTGSFLAPQALSELIEAAVRSGSTDTAHDALHRLSPFIVVGSDWAAGIYARSLALVSEGPAAEQSYVDAIACFARTPLRPDLARAQLLYGEWLRREHRRVDARKQLRSAHEAFAEMGAEPFAERARRELVATGERVRKRSADTRNDLTPQEEHIARLARDGRTNTEIAAELFLSARTVEWHLRKVFMKLGISSRRELRDAFAAPNR